MTVLVNTSAFFSHRTPPLLLLLLLVLLLVLLLGLCSRPRVCVCVFLCAIVAARVSIVSSSPGSLPGGLSCSRRLTFTPPADADSG